MRAVRVPLLSGTLATVDAPSHAAGAMDVRFPSGSAPSAGCRNRGQSAGNSVNARAQAAVFMGAWGSGAAVAAASIRARSGSVMADGIAMLPTVIAVARAEMRSEFLSFILMIHFVA